MEPYPAAARSSISDRREKSQETAGGLFYLSTQRYIHIYIYTNELLAGYNQSSRSEDAIHRTPKDSAKSNSRAVRVAIEFAVATEGTSTAPTGSCCVR